MSGVSPKIRRITPGEYRLLREFLYQAIYLPQGVDPPPRSVVDLPELQVYLRAGFRIAAHRGNEYLMLWELEHEKRQRILDARATK